MVYNLRRAKLAELLRRRATKYSARKTQALPVRQLKVASIPVISGMLTVPHAIIGGQALAIHGHPRATDDVDVLVNPSDLEQAVQDLGGKVLGPIAIGGKIVALPDGTEVDLVSPNTAFVQDAIVAAENTRFGRVVSKPYLVLLKLWASRGSQEDVDMINMLRVMSPAERKFTRMLVKRHLPNDLEDLQGLIEMSKYS